MDGPQRNQNPHRRLSLEERLQPRPVSNNGPNNRHGQGNKRSRTDHSDRERGPNRGPDLPAPPRNRWNNNNKNNGAEGGNNNNPNGQNWENKRFKQDRNNRPRDQNHQNNHNNQNNQNNRQVDGENNKDNAKKRKQKNRKPDLPRNPALNAPNRPQLPTAPASQRQNQGDNRTKPHHTEPNPKRRWRPKVTYRDDPIFKHILQVGEGTFGKVYKAQNQVSGAIVALKRLRLENEREGLPITAVREIKLLQSLHHSSIVSLREMVVSGKYVYMALEYIEHDLAGILLNPEFNLTPGNIKSLFRQAMSALAYLHHKDIIHRDIKGSNILVDSNGQIKLADFGLARRIDPSNPTAHYTNRVITLWYRPPELLLGATMYDAGVDVWSMGCLLVELFMRKALFHGKDEITQLEEIIKILGTPSWPNVEQLPWYYLLNLPQGKPNLLAETFTGVTPACFELASLLLEMDPTKRITSEQTLKHPYFEEEPKEHSITLTGEWHDFEAKMRRKKRLAAAEAPSSASVNSATTDRPEKS